MRHDGETRQCRQVKFLIQHPDGDAPTGTDFVSLMKEPSMPRSVRLTSGSMMHWMCSNGSVDSDVIVGPAVRSTVDQAPARPRRHEVAAVRA